MFAILKKIFGTANDRIIKKLHNEMLNINKLESEISNLTDEELKNKTNIFRKALNSGKTIDNIVYEAFAVMREAAKRVHSTRHFDVQIIAGLLLHRAFIIEMRTGEGKTLVATLPAYLNALTSKGVHIVTINDYLTTRDSAWMGKIYNFLGLSVGAVISGMEDKQRQDAYNCDITYVTNNELVFDYLRDNMKYSIESKILRPFNFAIIDEADSVLIDEARTPLIISGPVDDNPEIYNHINNLVIKLDETDYEKDEKSRSIHMTEVGIDKMESMLKKVHLIEENSGLYDFENESFVHYINQSLRANLLFRRDVDYIVKNNKVLIIDEFTGRIMDGRRYSEGLHQALEAKENLPIQKENQTLASITFQNYFKQYPKLAGMTGTAMTEAAELKYIYNLDVVELPTNKPITRKDLDDVIYGTKEDKYNAILKIVKERHDAGQPILIVTISIEKSEELSKLLQQMNIEHNVLNAKFHEKEASIIAQAGRFGAVTIATNMAGRGTDIVLGGNEQMMIDELKKKNLSDQEYQKLLGRVKVKVQEEKAKVIAAGGLLVIGTERYESRRIDNQARGRSGRQGDPGTTQFFLSLEDDLMRIFASEMVSNILRTLGLRDGEAIHHPMISRALEKAQQKVEQHHYEVRKNLLRFDDVLNQQRKVIYQQRNEIMVAKDVKDFFIAMAHETIDHIVSLSIKDDAYREDWDLDNLILIIKKIFTLDFTKDMFLVENANEAEIKEKIFNELLNLYQKKLESYKEQTFNDAANYILITTLDQVWKEHLYHLDHLRQGISLRAYGQKDPLNEYKKEAFNLFKKMLSGLRDLFLQRICHLDIELEESDHNFKILNAKEVNNTDIKMVREDPYSHGENIETVAKILSHNLYVAPENRISNDETSWGKVSRNELCPCSSGKKYKHCHGMK